MKKILCVSAVLLLAALILALPAFALQNEEVRSVYASSRTVTSTVDTEPDTTAPTNAPNEDSPLEYLVYITIALGVVLALTLAIIVLVNKKKEK
ncbi:MAG: hypothetical protein IJD35_04195 [Clostridia bacterium]|nr:hypothetical protein [Clostridia bacterium]